VHAPDDIRSPGTRCARPLFGLLLVFFSLLFPLIVSPPFFFVPRSTPNLFLPGCVQGPLPPKPAAAPRIFLSVGKRRFFSIGTEP